MKRKIVVAAIAALMGVGGYLAHRANATTPTDGLSELELANAEALADDLEIDLPGVSIFCDRGPTGRCFEPDERVLVDPCFYTPCRYTGFQKDFCSGV